MQLKVFLFSFLVGQVMASASFEAAKRFAKNVAISAAIMGTGATASAIYFPPDSFKQPRPITDPIQLAKMREKQLINAIKCEKDDEIKELLIEGANPNFKDDAGRTFMNYALTLKVKPHLVTQAIMSGLDLNRYDVSMRGTFLDGAIFVRKYDLAKILFEAGCPNSVPTKELIDFIVSHEANEPAFEKSPAHSLIMALYRGGGRDKSVLNAALSTAVWSGKYKIYEFLRSIEKYDEEWP